MPETEEHTVLKKSWKYQGQKPPPKKNKLNSLIQVAKNHCLQAGNMKITFFLVMEWKKSVNALPA
jgi:hypothetical protein